jgi:mono/diheme cytochrome c family protein
MSFAAAATLTDPYPVSQPRLLSAREVARVNCSMCHGVAGRGDGPVAHYFTPVPPVDFLSDRVRGRTDGQLFWLIANGIGNMPAFRALLSEPELWDVVLFVRKSGDGE